MPRDFLRTSGDLLADRRFAYAEASLAEGDAIAAADLYRQVLERVPRWPPAQHALGKALDMAGDAAGAAGAFRACLVLDPEDALGAGALLARLEGGTPAPDAMSDAYVAALFDDYAPRFDAHLVDTLGYRAPAVLAAALVEAASGTPAFSSAIDLGCGTGLMAREIAPWCGEISGIDLSIAMLREAEKTGLYARLANQGIEPFLAEEAEASATLVIAADVFCYVPVLEGVFAHARRVLVQDGRFAFTVQTHPGSGVIIGADARVQHAFAHIEALAKNAGFTVLIGRAASSRQDRGSAVPGAVFVLAPA